MKAVRLVKLGRPLEEADVEVPEIGASDVLIRVMACGICHSDAHYRAGISPIERLPVTLGHEVAGRVEQTGKEVTHVSAGDRVCVHYLAHCGSCEFCRRGLEQFCTTVQMIGKNRDGGYAEFIKVPGRSVFPLPDEIPFDVSAVIMCSSATALHALNKARLKSGESVAIFGFGGLGFSALQIAKALGASSVYVVDISQAKLAAASELGGVTIDATVGDPVKQIRQATGGKGVDVAVEFVGSPATTRQAITCLGALGRVACVGLTDKPLSIQPYTEVINREAEIIGVSDHLATELPMLMQMVRQGQLCFESGALRPIELDAKQINTVLDALEKTTDQIRTVIVPNTDA